MAFEARKLTTLFLLGVATAAVASACGDDSAASGTGGGGSGATGATTSTAATGSGGADVDPCSVVATTCFDAATCYADPPTGVSFNDDLLPILVRSCGLTSACHANRSSPTTSEGYKPYLGEKGGASDVALIRAAILDVDAWGDPSRKVVAPGDWEASYFMNKLDGALDDCGQVDCLDCGRLMPQGSPKPLPIAERNLFRAWIAEGALDN